MPLSPFLIPRPFAFFTRFFYPAQVLAAMDAQVYLVLFDGDDSLELAVPVLRRDVVLDGERVDAAVRLHVGQRVAALWPAISWRGTAGPDAVADTSPAAVTSAAMATTSASPDDDQWPPQIDAIADPDARLFAACIVGHVGPRDCYVVAFEGGSRRLLSGRQLVLSRRVHPYTAAAILVQRHRRSDVGRASDNAPQSSSS